jgi:hypothetical protein
MPRADAPEAQSTSTERVSEASRKTGSSQPMVPPERGGFCDERLNAVKHVTQRTYPTAIH